MEEIKLCPFCGEQFQVVGDDDWGWSYFHYSNCIMRKEEETGYIWRKRKDVVASLNQRPKITT